MSSSNSPTTQQPRPVLRRATYVHVSDLTSPYNIDHAKLEEEVARVIAERENTTESTKASNLVEPEVDPNTAASELDTALAVIPQKRLQPPRGGYNLCVLVGKVTIVVDKRRVDQSRVRLAEVEIGDETGTVSLRARDEQIDILMEVSERSGAIVLRNCTLELYQGRHIRLAVTKWGKLSVYPDNVASTPPPPSKMNFDRNFSRIDLSVVASEMVDPQPDATYNSAQSKLSEANECGSRGGSSKGSQSFGRNQGQSSTRRGGRDRRQQKGKQGPLSVMHYSGLPADQSPYGAHRGLMSFQGLPAYPVFDQTIEMSQYAYPHGRHQQEQALPPATAQHMMMRQQYELQQQQLQQMYRGHQDAYRGVSQTQGQGLLRQQLIPAASYDASEYQMPTHPSSGSSPILIPMNMSNVGSSHHTGGRMSRGDGRPGDIAEIGVQGQGRDVNSNQYMSVSPDDSHLSQGKMNPDATAFAPAFVNPQANANPVYFSYDHSHTTNTAGYTSQIHHPAVYSGGAVYSQAAGSSRATNPKESVSTENAQRTYSSEQNKSEPQKSG